MYRIFNIKRNEVFLFQDENKGIQMFALYYDCQKDKAIEICDRMNANGHDQYEVREIYGRRIEE